MTASVEQLVLDQRQGGVAILTLNRPDVLNAINDALMAALLSAIRSLAADESVRCVVVTGAGRGFCSGGDMKNRPSPQGGARPSAEQRAAFLRKAMDAASLLHSMPKPTIAMINGPCAGAGVGLAGACDIRFAARSATIRSAFVEVGLAGDYGATWFWTQLLGSAKAREFFLLSKRFTAGEALDFGLVTRVFDDSDLLTETLALANNMADNKPWAFRLAKDSLNHALSNDLPAQLDVEAANSVKAAAEVRRDWKARQAADAREAGRDEVIAASAERSAEPPG
ncbi:enoyl-CoA hydratase/isomerase family protein [Sphingomonas sp. SRS2]|uniref:enoyl-CoA hydratase/isomerase family protein n=1 Tax=Sphingomonas sp. SRS2 TaxID=133190 RepID=UPI0006977C00|nr:enoyl-CoA hydratase-related protein [Sphingomonas sp. SRS2]